MLRKTKKNEMRQYKFDLGKVTVYETDAEIEEIILKLMGEDTLYRYQAASATSYHLKEIAAIEANGTQRVTPMFLKHYKEDGVEVYSNVFHMHTYYKSEDNNERALFLQYYEKVRNIPMLEKLAEQVNKGTMIYHAKGGKIESHKVIEAKMECKFNLKLRISLEPAGMFPYPIPLDSVGVLNNRIYAASGTSLCWFTDLYEAKKVELSALLQKIKSEEEKLAKLKTKYIKIKNFK